MRVPQRVERRPSGQLCRFHGGNTGSNPVGDATPLTFLHEWLDGQRPAQLLSEIEMARARALVGNFWGTELIPESFRMSLQGDNLKR
jgi:hypothetical protein